METTEFEMQWHLRGWVCVGLTTYVEHMVVDKELDFLFENDSLGG